MSDAWSVPEEHRRGPFLVHPEDECDCIEDVAVFATLDACMAWIASLVAAEPIDAWTVDVDSPKLSVDYPGLYPGGADTSRPALNVIGWMAPHGGVIHYRLHALTSVEAP